MQETATRRAEVDQSVAMAVVTLQAAGTIIPAPTATPLPTATATPSPTPTATPFTGFKVYDTATGRQVSEHPLEAPPETGSVFGSAGKTVVEYRYGEAVSSIAVPAEQPILILGGVAALVFMTGVVVYLGYINYRMRKIRYQPSPSTALVPNGTWMSLAARNPKLVAEVADELERMGHEESNSGDAGSRGLPAPAVGGQ
jgi:hypothetical protein